jgi:hypothetical protein
MVKFLKSEDQNPPIKTMKKLKTFLKPLRGTTSLLLLTYKIT